MRHSPPLDDEPSLVVSVGGSGPVLSTRMCVDLTREEYCGLVYLFRSSSARYIRPFLWPFLCADSRAKFSHIPHYKRRSPVLLRSLLLLLAQPPRENHHHERLC